MKSIDEILAEHRADAITDSVTIKGEVFTVREMTGSERDIYEQMVYGQSSTKDSLIRNARALMVAMTCIDDDGRLRFGEAQVEQVGQMPASALNKIFQCAAKLNLLTATAIEETQKN
jgi:hypothetical protein